LTQVVSKCVCAHNIDRCFESVARRNKLRDYFDWHFTKLAHFEIWSKSRLVSTSAWKACKKRAKNLQIKTISLRMTSLLWTMTWRWGRTLVVTKLKMAAIVFAASCKQIWAADSQFPSFRDH